MEVLAQAAGLMNSIRALSVGIAVGFLLVVSLASPPPAGAAWVTVNGGQFQFQVGGQLDQIVPTAAGTPFVNPTCGSTGSAKGGTSLALVPTLLQGLQLAGVNPVEIPLVLVVSCLDTNTTIGRRLNFINPADGRVVAQISTSTVPSSGYPHFVFRPDKGDLLACGENGALHRIRFLEATGTPPTAPTTQLTNPPFPSDATPSCAGLTWDAEADVIYMGLKVGGGNKIGRVIRFKEGSTTLSVPGDFTSLSCTANGLAISGGVLLMSCVSPNNPSATDPTMLRLDKTTGIKLGVFGQGSATNPLTMLPNPFHPPVGLGDLACDPVTFHNDQTTGKDLFTDALWSRLGDTGNTVVALEFPAFTCGLPSNSVANQNSPLAAGLSAAAGAVPLAACFDQAGNVLDMDGDGLPDCWEDPWSDGKPGIDFDGDGVRDFTLCVSVDKNGDGVPDAPDECAAKNHKDLFVEIDYMRDHRPDAKALSQTQSVDTLKPDGTFVGVQSVREAFAAAPVCNPSDTLNCTPTGIKIHFQVDEQPVTFTPLSGPPTSHVDQVVFTPCTASAGSNPAQTADFDTIKAANFGTFNERSSPSFNAKLNAKRLAFRYVLFAHNLAPSPTGGAAGSGCAEVGGDDAVVSLGTFASTTVGGVSHNRGTTDQQAGTFMHEFGHLLGFRHGGLDPSNCKPNYRSVMNYTRQFSGSPISNRRLDYSRSLDPSTTGGVLDKNNLFEKAKLGTDPSLFAINPFFPSPDQIVFGPNAWSLVSPLTLPNGVDGINWNRSFGQGGKTPTYQDTPVGPLNINAGATAGCDGSGDSLLDGQDDWNNILYRASATIDFAGGGRTETPVEMTKDDETAFFNAKDVDGNGIGDGQDCAFIPTAFTSTPVDPTATSIPIGMNPTTLGFAASGTAFLGDSPDFDDFSYTGTDNTGFKGVTRVSAVRPSGTAVTPLCTHRIDIKPSFPFPKTINPGTEANITVAIFSEKSGTQVWNAPTQVILIHLDQFPLTFSVEPFVVSVKVNKQGGGTCSISDVEDPISGQKDGIKDLKCQFPVTADLPTGTHFGVVSGFFTVVPSADPLSPDTEVRAFSARQEVTILP
jgi:hypothetical protein